MRSLILVGGGGHCKSVIDAAESAGYTIRGILDLPKYVGRKVYNYSVIGTDSDIPKYVDDNDFIVTLGFIKDASSRIHLHDKIRMAGGCLATIIASTAYVSKYAKIDLGTVILHQVSVNADVKIGKGCIINTFANIEHDSIIGDYCHISTGAMVNGDCEIGEATFLGSQSVMVNGISIMAGSVIAAGSVIQKNIIQRGIYSGNPAKLVIRL